MTAVPGYDNYDQTPPKDLGLAAAALNTSANPRTRPIADPEQYAADIAAVTCGTGVSRAVTKQARLLRG